MLLHMYVRYITYLKIKLSEWWYEIAPKRLNIEDSWSSEVYRLVRKKFSMPRS
jgi:hypothetical protein